MFNNQLIVNQLGEIRPLYITTTNMILPLYLITMTNIKNFIYNLIIKFKIYHNIFIKNYSAIMNKFINMTPLDLLKYNHITANNIEVKIIYIIGFVALYLLYSLINLNQNYEKKTSNIEKQFEKREYFLKDEIEILREKNKNIESKLENLEKESQKYQLNITEKIDKFTEFNKSMNKQIKKIEKNLREFN